MAKTVRNKVAWIVFILLAIGIGLYPLFYLFANDDFGLLLSKSEEILASDIWNLGFYGHISFGGLALLSGWSQFSKILRAKNLNIHRLLGRVYVISVLISGLCGVYIGFYATGGWVSSLGFICLGLVWMFTTVLAYVGVKRKDMALHQGMMIYSYSACFAAVTLRIWLPMLTVVFGEFLTAYRIVAWLCWVPNILFAYVWVRRKGITLV